MYNVYASDEIERLRKKSQRIKFVKRLMNFVLVVAIFAAVLLVPQVVLRGGRQDMIMPIAMGIWIGAIILSLIVQHFNKKALQEFKTLYKNEFVRRVVRENMENAEYYADQGFSREAVREFRLVRPASRFFSEDCIKGEYQGAYFEQSDVTIIQPRSKQSDLVCFKGRMLKISGLSTQRADVQIFSGKFNHRVASVNGGASMHGTLIPTAAKTVGEMQTADEEFSKLFDIYSTDENDTLRLLTPSLMEALKRMQGRYASMALRFVGNEVYVAVNTGHDTFECDSRKAIDYDSEACRIAEDLNEMKGIIGLFL